MMPTFHSILKWFINNNLTTIVIDTFDTHVNDDNYKNKSFFREAYISEYGSVVITSKRNEIYDIHNEEHLFYRLIPVYDRLSVIKRQIQIKNILC